MQNLHEDIQRVSKVPTAAELLAPHTLLHDLACSCGPAQQSGIQPLPMQRVRSDASAQTACSLTDSMHLASCCSRQMRARHPSCYGV